MYRGPSFSAVVFHCPLPPFPPASRLDRRRTGRLRKRDNFLTGEGEGLGVEPEESLVLYKSFNTLWFVLRECSPLPFSVGRELASRLKKPPFPPPPKLPVWLCVCISWWKLGDRCMHLVCVRMCSIITIHSCSICIVLIPLWQRRPDLRPSQILFEYVNWVFGSPRLQARKQSGSGKQIAQAAARILTRARSLVR